MCSWGQLHYTDFRTDVCQSSELHPGGLQNTQSQACGPHALTCTCPPGYDLPPTHGMAFHPRLLPRDDKWGEADRVLSIPEMCWADFIFHF